MTHFFQFEADFVESLRCIPMQVRFNLDTCGIKLKLSHWHQFSKDECLTLMKLPCDTPEDIQYYQEFLQKLIGDRALIGASELPVDPHPPWRDAAVIPTSVAEKAKDLGVAISLEQWAALTPLERFALIKLSRPSHENRNFLPALKEFSLII